MKSTTFLLFSCVSLFPLPALAAELPARLSTHLTDGEKQREAYDLNKFPHFMKYIESIDPSKRMFPTDPRNQKWVRTSQVFTPTVSMWSGFFKAAAQDHVTSLRAFALISREIKKHGVVVFGPGADFEHGVSDNNVDLGLALPATHIGCGIWSPDPDNKDPEFLLHLKIFYNEPYVHKFPDEILPANLKIGLGPEETYWMDGQEYHQHTVDTDIYYGGDETGVGFRNVKGIGGQKRGFMGVLQSVMFFLPDAISSMTIREKNNEMKTEALMDTIISNFESDPRYAISIKGAQ